MIVDLDPSLRQVPHQRSLEDAQQFFDYAEAQFGNVEMPTFAHKAEIQEAIRDNQFVILMAETGAGKSTQVPQFAVEMGFDNIYVTQPRRRAAMNVAERIQSEISASVGAAIAAETVSYQTGAGLVGSRQAPIKVVTDGLHFIRDGLSYADNDLWIIDEVHEWNVNVEAIMALGKRRAAENPNFRMVVMSATIDKEKLTRYCTTKEGVRPAVIEVAGRMHKVEYKEEPKSTVAKEIINCATEISNNPDLCGASNTIQVFVAGKGEIKDTIKKLQETLPPDVLRKSTIIPLHAKMSLKKQAPAYEDIDGIKIIVQTKMGQTSMTVPRTRYVISSGLERRTELDDEDASGLMLRPISQDDIDQQMGRTGRTCEGTFILTRMNEKTKFISKASREKHQTAEISRTNIDRLTLYFAAAGLDIAEVETYHKIAPASIARSKRRTSVLGGIDAQGNVTLIGKRMLGYPLNNQLSRSMVEAEKYGCTIRAAMAAIAACQEAGGILMRGQGTNKGWKELSSDTSSDLLSELDVFTEIQGKRLDEIMDYDLDFNNIIRAQEHYRKVVKNAGVNPDMPLKKLTEDERVIIRECIASGSLNNIYLPVGKGFYMAMGGSAVRRKISSQSIARNTHSVIVATPRNSEKMRKGKMVDVHELENVTTVIRADLGRIALPLTHWEHKGYTQRGGIFKRVENLVLGHDTVTTREVPADPSPLLRATILELTKANPGKQLIRLYKIKSELERLAHRSKVPIPRLTEDAINDMLDKATPENVTDLSLVEENLREAIIEQGISLESFLSSDDRDSIVINSPPAIACGDISFGLRYVSGKVIVKRQTPDMIGRLPENMASLRLEDGREVMFDYEKKRYTLQQLRKRLEHDGLL